MCVYDGENASAWGVYRRAAARDSAMEILVAIAMVSGTGYGSDWDSMKPLRERKMEIHLWRRWRLWIDDMVEYDRWRYK